MSEEEEMDEIETLLDVIDIPDIGKVTRESKVITAAASIRLKMNAPEDRYVKGFILNVRGTPSATGTGTSYIADMIQSITIRNEYGQIVYESAGHAIGMTALLAAYLYKYRRGSAIGLIADDAVMAATATAYDLYAKILQPLFGRNFTVDIEFKKADTTNMAGFSAVVNCTMSVVCVPILDVEPDYLTAMKGEVLTSITSVDREGLGFAAAIDGTELSTVITALTFGRKALSSADIQLLENLLNSAIAGGTPDAGVVTDAAVYVPGVKGPHSATTIYAISLYDEEYETSAIHVALSTGTTVILVVVKNLPIPEVEAEAD